MFDNDYATIHLLGYLTEEQWIDSLSQHGLPGGVRDSIKEYAKAVDRSYSTGWSDKLRKLIGS